MNQVPGQLSLFDLSNENEDINFLSEKEMVDILNRRLNLNLKYDSFFEDYRQKLKSGFTVSVEYSRYFGDEEWGEPPTGDLFIAVGIMSNRGGYGGPCDTLEEAIECIQGHIDRWCK